MDIKFHEYKNKMFAEIAYSTNKGNGYIVLYEIEDEELEMLLTIQGAVDRNLDTTTNTVFGNGRMSVQLQESNMQSDMPKVIVEGTELVYGYSEPLNYTGNELLYQRNHIQYEYEWNEEKEIYDEVGKSRELLQQVDGVYPVSWGH